MATTQETPQIITRTVHTVPRIVDSTIEVKENMSTN